jgi:deazaflavin-dependent oxidoreductase (nitroreductase family)
VPGIAVLETTGRNSGQPRRTPVGRFLDGDTFWIVVEHGRKSSYVRNIEADPSVPIKIIRRWRTGTAHLMPDDDPRARQRAMPAANTAVVRLMGTTCSPCESTSTPRAATSYFPRK